MARPPLLCEEGNSLREYIETLESLVKQYAMLGTAVQRPADARRVAVASAIGTTIEWYDFFIYGTAAAVVFAPQFFPQVSPLAGMLAACGRPCCSWYFVLCRASRSEASGAVLF